MKRALVVFEKEIEVKTEKDRQFNYNNKQQQRSTKKKLEQLNNFN